MTIIRRIGLGFGIIIAGCLVLVAWLGYHEFVVEPRKFAARGVSDIHEDTAAELSTEIFLAALPVLLVFSWWWMRRVLAPLHELSSAIEQLGLHNLHQPLPRTGNGDEVDKLSAGFNDMTARLGESLHRIHEFTLHASHELKTPLTVMQAHLETALRESKALPPEQTEWIDDQLTEVKRLTRIVDSLTLLTKADAGLIELEHEPVPLHELMEEAFEDAQVLAQPRRVAVTLGPCGEATVTGDRQRLRQLLLILTDNAVKYNRPGGTLELSLQRHSDKAELCFTNTSREIAPQTLRNAFARFVRGENAQGKVEGCGLGLTIAQWIVQAHGGNIELSPASGGKVTALVRLPTVPVRESAFAGAGAEI